MQRIFDYLSKKIGYRLIVNIINSSGHPENGIVEPDRALDSRGCGFPELRGVMGMSSFFSLHGVENESLLEVGSWPPPACSSSELDPRSKTVFLDVAFFSANKALDSRKSLRFGDAEGGRADPDGADLIDFTIRLLLLVPNFTFSTSVFSAGRLDLLKMFEVRSLGLELGAGVKAGFWNLSL